LELLNVIGHTSKNGKERQEVSRKIGEGTLDKGNLATLDKYNFFQLVKRRSILTTISSQIDLALKHAPSGIPRYFRGREEVPQPKMTANSVALSTLPTGNKGDSAKLTFKPNTASKHNKRTRR
jgi:hypothetical protein